MPESVLDTAKLQKQHHYSYIIGDKRDSHLEKLEDGAGEEYSEGHAIKWL